MTDFSKPIQRINGDLAEVLCKVGGWLWICCPKDRAHPWTWSIEQAEQEFKNIPKPRVLYLRVMGGDKAYCSPNIWNPEDSLHEGKNYRITLVDGQPPKTEEIK